MIYPAIVRDVHDPARGGRIRVECPEVYGAEELSPWAVPVFPPFTAEVPLEGSLVWIVLRDGDPRYPVWIGQGMFLDGTGAPEAFREWTPGEVEQELRDFRDHSNPDDQAEHREVEGHGHPPYYDPYRYVKEWPLGETLKVDATPSRQSIEILDRLGQGVRFAGEPVNSTDPHDETVKRNGRSFYQNTTFDATELSTSSLLYRNTGYKAVAEFGGVHGQKLSIRVKNQSGQEEIELLNTTPGGGRFHRLLMSLLAGGITIEDHQGQRLRIRSSGDRGIEVTTGVGDSVKLSTEDGSVEIANRHGARVRITSDGIDISSPGTVNVNGAQIKLGGGAVNGVLREGSQIVLMFSSMPIPGVPVMATVMPGSGSRVVKSS